MAGKAILDGSRSEQVIFDYRPKEFPIVATESAKDFSSKKHAASHTGAFTINPLIAEKAGISRLQTESLERAVEAQALEKLKEVQERAYREAFELGLAEGTEKAFDSHKEEFSSRLAYLDVLMNSFEELKFRLVAENEAQMVKLIFEISKRLALREIKENPEVILEMIRKVVEDSQTEERLVIKISPDDFKFIEGLGELNPRDKEMMSKIRLEAEASVTSGGCLLETNYGSIDASIEQRVSKVWETLSSRAPKIKDSQMGLPKDESVPDASDDHNSDDDTGEKS